ncbi:MAG: DUF1868 domain-containing protein [Marivita sp.]|uniref:DUF1868 domain-containing protein n=1 Tax=Marivita sp. TaxID=2003365 RepID=UPI001B08C93E|nr:DUF1868 domain-containing protein [Marivita sp.]MBO6885032.1 DUF1868 domain-containing protein [Marivita sp.]
MTDHERAFDYLTGALTGGAAPSAVGLKFTPDGQPLTCRGNTTICHVDPGSKPFAALVDAQDQLKAGPLADEFTFLPPESFHMTIFEGVIDYDRTSDRWPGHLPNEASVDTVTMDFADRLQDIGLTRTVIARPTGIFGGFSVRMSGADKSEEALLRLTRDQLQAATNLVRPDHDAYEFHITLAYNLRWFSPEEARSIIALSDRVGAELLERVPRIVLGPVEFCTFETMHHFERDHWID